MSNLTNIVIYILIFAGGFLVHKFVFANREQRESKGWTNREFDSTLTLLGLFILVGIMLFMFQDDLKEDASLVMISILGYVGLAVKDAFPPESGKG
ncbi:MAG: hypothetical protein OXH00_26140 [Candidatus Poribacteria bacterium]|nr:hypothetical protein [Candidatus Poribacteria bacterium]